MAYRISCLTNYRWDINFITWTNEEPVTFVFLFHCETKTHCLDWGRYKTVSGKIGFQVYDAVTLVITCPSSWKDTFFLQSPSLSSILFNLFVSLILGVYHCSSSHYTLTVGSVALNMCLFFLYKNNKIIINKYFIILSSTFEIIFDSNVKMA